MTKVIDLWATRWLWLARAIITFSCLIVLGYALDRKPPFKVLGNEIGIGWRGESVTIKADVWRDTSRNCSAEFSRYLFDSSGTRFDLGNSQASAELIRKLEEITPGKLVLTFQVPSGAATGRAKLMTSLQYTCNFIHALRPIEVTTEMSLIIL